MKTGNSTRKKNDTASKALLARYADLKSWGKVASELRYKSRGVLCDVAAGKRKASRPLIDKLNSAYGLHLHYETKIEVDPLPCGCAPSGTRCKVHQPAPKYAPHPVMRLSKIRRILQSPYKDS
jgi:hypothetical protein